MANNWRKPDTWSVETQHKAKYLLFVTGLAIAAVLVGFTGWSLTHHHTSADAHAPAPPATASEKHAPTPASPLPSYEPPAYPLKAKTNNQEGAKAFLEYFIDELNYAGWTSDLTEFKKLYNGDECQACKTFEKLVQNNKDTGNKGYKGAYKISTVSFTQQPEPNAYQGVFTVDRDEAGLIDKNGKISGVNPAIKGREVTFYIRWSHENHFVISYVNEANK